MGFFQTVAATPGVAYELTADSGAQAWWQPEGEMRLIFLDASNNVLAQNTQVTVDPTSWTANDQGQAWSLFSLTATAPANTTQAKVNRGLWVAAPVRPLTPQPEFLIPLYIGPRNLLLEATDSQQ